MRPKASEDDKAPLKAEETFLELPSDLIGQDPEDFRQSLLSALTSLQSVTLSGRNVSRIGTSALQLLVAFRRDAAALGVSVELKDPSQPLLDTLVTLGLAEAVGLVAAPH